MKADLYHGDCREVLAALPAESVHCCVTSPPYFGLRDYGAESQIGLEPSPAEFVATMVAVFEEVRRVLRSDGTLWLNLGDSYANDGKWGGSTGGKHVQALHGTNAMRAKRTTGLKSKDLIGIPWRVAFALQDAGWYLRSDVIWAKPNPMPSSVADRPTTSHEYLFLLAKSARYFYDADAIREPHVDYRPTKSGASAFRGQALLKPRGRDEAADRYYHVGGRNKRSVWTIAPRSFPEAHFATFPPELATPPVLAGSSDHGCCPACGAPYRRRTEPTTAYARHLGKDWSDAEADEREGRGHFALSGGGRASQRQVKRGAPSVTAEYVTTGWDAGCSCDAGAPVPCTVLDPFNGAGTTGLVAVERGRDYVGIDVNRAYLEMSERRIRNGSPLFGETEVVIHESAAIEPVEVSA